MEEKGNVEVWKVDRTLETFLETNAEMFGERMEDPFDIATTTGKLIVHTLSGYKTGLYYRNTIATIMLWYVTKAELINGCKVKVDSELAELGVGEHGSLVSTNCLELAMKHCSSVTASDMDRIECEKDDMTTTMHFRAAIRTTGERRGGDPWDDILLSGSIPKSSALGFDQLLGKRKEGGAAGRRHP